MFAQWAIKRDRWHNWPLSNALCAPGGPSYTQELVAWPPHFGDFLGAGFLCYGFQMRKSYMTYICVFVHFVSLHLRWSGQVEVVIESRIVELLWNVQRLDLCEILLWLYLRFNSSMKCIGLDDQYLTRLTSALPKSHDKGLHSRHIGERVFQLLCVNLSLILRHERAMIGYCEPPIIMDHWPGQSC